MSYLLFQRKRSHSLEKVIIEKDDLRGKHKHHHKDYSKKRSHKKGFKTTQSEVMHFRLTIVNAWPDAIN